MAEEGKNGKPKISHLDLSDRKIERNLKKVAKCVQKGDCLRDTKAKMHVSYDKSGKNKIPISIDINIKKAIPGFHRITWEGNLWNGTEIELQNDPNLEQTCTKKKMTLKWTDRPLATWKCFKENIFGDREKCGEYADPTLTCEKGERVCPTERFIKKFHTEKSPLFLIIFECSMILGSNKKKLSSFPWKQFQTLHFYHF